MRSRCRRVVRSMTAPVRRGALVLLYHRAAILEADPWRLAVTPAHFDEHLDILARCTLPATVGGLLETMNAGRIQERTVVVTFDDGYADLATAVRPRLERAGVPATMFLVSRAIGRQTEFWWDALERAVWGAPVRAEPLRLTIGGSTRTWDVATAPTRSEVYREIWSALRERHPSERDRLVESVLDWARVAPTARPSHRTLTNDELAALAVDDLVEIGTHTADHPWLAGLSSAEQAHQVESGRAELEAVVGRPIDAFAYPHGGLADIGGAADAVRAAGLSTAFLAMAGLVHPSSDRLALPRLFVEDMDGEGFARLLWRHAGIRVS